jgi:hypothetical protein
MFARNELIAAFAGPKGHMPLGQWLGRAARKTGVSSRMLRSIYYGNVGESHAAFRLLETRAGIATLSRRLEALTTQIRRKDPESYHNELNALRDMARALLDLDRT